MGGRGTPLEVGHSTCACLIIGTDDAVTSTYLRKSYTEGCLNFCYETKDVIGRCRCGTYIEGNNIGGCSTSSSDAFKEEASCVGGFKLGCITVMLLQYFSWDVQVIVLLLLQMIW